MKEIAFIVKPDSDFYRDYFDAKEEKDKFHNLAKEFFEKYDLVDSGKYYQTEFLGLELNSEQRKRFESQLKKYDDENGMSRFKKNSPMQKSWNEEVTSKVDLKLIDKTKFWYFSLILSGSYSLWDCDGVIYGYLKDNNRDDIKLVDYMMKIKMSEYYSVIEKIESNESA